MKVTDFVNDDRGIFRAFRRCRVQLYLLSRRCSICHLDRFGAFGSLSLYRFRSRGSSNEEADEYRNKDGGPTVGGLMPVLRFRAIDVHLICDEVSLGLAKHVAGLAQTRPKFHEMKPADDGSEF